MTGLLLTARSSPRKPVGRSTPGIYIRLIQLCRAAMGDMPSRAPCLPFRPFFSFVRLWAPVPLRAPPAGVVWGSIAPQTVAGRADGRTEIKRVQFSSVQFSGQAWRFLRQASIRFVCVPPFRIVLSSEPARGHMITSCCQLGHNLRRRSEVRNS